MAARPFRWPPGRSDGHRAVQMAADVRRAVPMAARPFRWPQCNGWSFAKNGSSYKITWTLGRGAERSQRRGRRKGQRKGRREGRKYVWEGVGSLWGVFLEGLHFYSKYCCFLWFSKQFIYKGLQEKTPKKTQEKTPEQTSIHADPSHGPAYAFNKLHRSAFTAMLFRVQARSSPPSRLCSRLIRTHKACSMA